MSDALTVSEETPEAQDHLERYGHGNRWRVVDGEEIPPAKQEKFMTEWCMVWPRPCTQIEWAKRNGVSPRSLQNWLTDERFLRVWRKRADDLYASPAWTFPAITRAYEIGMGQVDGFSASEQAKFMTIYLTMVEKMSPPTIHHRHEVVQLPHELEQMSDKELLAIATGDDDVIDAEIVDG